MIGASPLSGRGPCFVTRRYIPILLTLEDREPDETVKIIRAIREPFPSPDRLPPSIRLSPR